MDLFLVIGGRDYRTPRQYIPGVISGQMSSDQNPSFIRLYKGLHYVISGS